jgi:hypothetical protein
MGVQCYDWFICLFWGLLLYMAYVFVCNILAVTCVLCILAINYVLAFTFHGLCIKLCLPEFEKFIY